MATCLWSHVWVFCGIVQKELIRELREVGKLNEEEIAAIPYSFFVERCRRKIKPPDQIIRDVESLLELYQATEYLIPGDPEKGIPDRERALVTEGTWEVWRREKPHVGKCLADPPGVNLYIEKTRKEGETGKYIPGNAKVDEA